MRSRRFYALFLLLIAFAPLLPTPARAAVSSDNQSQSSAAFGSSLFERIWSRTDLPVSSGAAARSWVWGPEPGPVVQEPFGGGTRTVQYFDKARMEVNPDVKDQTSPWAATTGLLVVEMVSGKVQTGPDTFDARTPAAIAVAGDNQANSDAPTYASFQNLASVPGAADHSAKSAKGTTVTATVDRAGNVGKVDTSDVQYVAYSAETGHNIPDVFWSFMQSSGVVYDSGAYQNAQLFDPTFVAGYPITEAYWATVPIDGKPTRVLIQLYQRRVLTYIPGYDPAWQVQMGNVGQNYYNWRYNQPLPLQSAAPTPAAPAPTAPTTTGAGTANDSFVGVSGDKFMYAGAPVTIKGTNYWISTEPFVSTWADWDGPQALKELAKARDLGVNAIRVGLPYDHAKAVDVVWGDKRSELISGAITNRMTQLLQIASVYGMKVIFALFDYSDNFPADGSKDWRKQMNYIQGIVGPFANDDRVLAWDLHNEPDQYGTWTGGSPQKVIDWAGRISTAIRSLDQKHPLTIGVATYSNLWLAPNGKSLLDYSDFVSFHDYDAGSLGAQIDSIRQHTGKPILLEEMGWPTGPSEQSKSNATYDEATQEYLYKTMLTTAKDKNIGGVAQWTLYDFPGGSTTGNNTASYEEWFGLVRLDGSLKPAALDFMDMYPTRVLPSATTSNVGLTRTNPSAPAK